ncbi:hypothetical protein ACFSC4_26930 [Deinococcus malanensis]|uniref:hypothetical protein n=1 Tax=Deinococcus malanensis TaxID=1706855 RepID=UPI00362C32F1
MICAHRSGEMTPGGEAFIRQQVAEGKAVLIELEALDESFVRRLVGDLDVPELAALSPRLAQFTGGNPQFLLETIRHLIEKDGLHTATGRLPLPPRVGEVLTRRLQGLSPSALQAARAAAVLQSDYSFDLVAEVLGAPLLAAANAWAELEAAHIMHEERCSHDLVYEAVEAGMPAAVQRLLHRRAARVLSGHRAPPGRVARHWLSGGDPGRAAPLLLEAAADAAATGRLREADDLYSLAVSALIATGDQEGAQRVQILQANLNMPGALQGELLPARRLRDFSSFSPEACGFLAPTEAEKTRGVVKHRMTKRFWDTNEGAYRSARYEHARRRIIPEHAPGLPAWNLKQLAGRPTGRLPIASCADAVPAPPTWHKSGHPEHPELQRKGLW